MALETELLSLVSRIYAAAEDGSQWSGFVTALLDATRCQAGGFYAIDLAGRAPVLNTAMGVDAAFLDSYEQHFASRNPWDAAAQRSGRFTPGVVVLSDELLERPELERTEYYADWLEPQGLASAANICLAREDRFVANMTLLRSRKAGSFSNDECAMITALTPHVQRAVRIHQQLGGLRAVASAWQDVVDRLSTGVILLGRMARVIHMNAAARTVVSARDGIHVSADGQVLLATPKATLELRKLLDATVATSLGCGVSAGGFVRAPRTASPEALQIVVSPVAPGISPAPDTPAAVLFITDPAASATIERDALRVMFGLTDAEAEVAARLASGQSLSSIAGSLFVSLHTVRTHLKSIFSKTGTHRQPELVQRILSGNPTLR